MRLTLTEDDFLIMREAGKVGAEFACKLADKISAGMTTKDVEIVFDDFLSRFPDMTPAFKGYMGYPASLCVSVNEEVIHGIPSVTKVINEGDLVSVDLGIRYKDRYIDMARTYCVGNCSEIATRIVDVTQTALTKAIELVRPGVSVGDIGAAVQSYVEGNSFSVVRKFVGHGIGEELHLPPEVPNFGQAKTGYVLKEGDAIAIEPMVCEGGYKVNVLDDNWTVVTADAKLSAHCENTIAVTKDGNIIITG